MKSSVKKSPAKTGESDIKKPNAKATDTGVAASGAEAAVGVPEANEVTRTPEVTETPGVAGQFFQCPIDGRDTEPIGGDSTSEDAMDALGCRECALRRPGTCRGPLKVEREAASELLDPLKLLKPKKTKAKTETDDTSTSDTSPTVSATSSHSGTSSNPGGKAGKAVKMTKSVFQEKACRQALTALAAPKYLEHAAMLKPLRAEIQAARDAGRSWEAIAKVLKQFGYNIGESMLRRVMEAIDEESAGKANVASVAKTERGRNASRKQRDAKGK